MMPISNSVIEYPQIYPPQRAESAQKAGLVTDGMSDAERNAVEKLRSNEEQVRTQEANLLSKGGEYIKSVDYKYTTGPDGKRYVSSVSVKIEAPEEVMRAMGEAGGAGVTVEKAASGERSSGAAAVPEGKVDGKATSPMAMDPETQQVIRQLQQTDNEVRAHEAAHKGAGGQYAGAASYGYTTGPDGRQYAVSGEVPISAPSGGTPEETMQIMSQVRAAALAPASPSGPDMAVAAAASAAIAAAGADIAKQDAPAPGASAGGASAGGAPAGGAQVSSSESQEASQVPVNATPQDGPQAAANSAAQDVADEVLPEGRVQTKDVPQEARDTQAMRDETSRADAPDKATAAGVSEKPEKSTQTAPRAEVAAQEQQDTQDTPENQAAAAVNQPAENGARSADTGTPAIRDGRIERAAADMTSGARALDASDNKQVRETESRPQPDSRVNDAGNSMSESYAAEDAAEPAPDESTFAQAAAGSFAGTQAKMPNESTPAVSENTNNTANSPAVAAAEELRAQPAKSMWSELSGTTAASVTDTAKTEAMESLAGPAMAAAFAPYEDKSVYSAENPGRTDAPIPAVEPAQATEKFASQQDSSQQQGMSDSGLREAVQEAYEPQMEFSRMKAQAAPTDPMLTGEVKDESLDMVA